MVWSVGPVSGRVWYREPSGPTPRQITGCQVHRCGQDVTTPCSGLPLPVRSNRVAATGRKEKIKYLVYKNFIDKKKKYNYLVYKKRIDKGNKKYNNLVHQKPIDKGTHSQTGVRQSEAWHRQIPTSAELWERSSTPTSNRVTTTYTLPRTSRTPLDQASLALPRDSHLHPSSGPLPLRHRKELPESHPSSLHEVPSFFLSFYFSEDNGLVSL